MLKFSGEDIHSTSMIDRIPFAPIALLGRNGSGKSSWLKKHRPGVVNLLPIPKKEEWMRMKRWRLLHLLRFDLLLFHRIESELNWRCPECGRTCHSGSFSTLSERLRQDFSAMVLIGFPFSGSRESLVDKGYWRIMTPSGVAPLPQDSWIEADILVDRLNMGKVDEGRLSETVNQCMVAGLGSVVASCGGVRHTYSTRFLCPQCQIDTERFSSTDFFSWIQGKKARSPGWGGFEWQGVSLPDLLDQSSMRWLDGGERYGRHSWWKGWEQRMTILCGCGLGNIPLSRSLGSLSSSERSLFVLSRCLTWKIGGQDLLLDYQSVGLSAADARTLTGLMAHLGNHRNRVWLENPVPELLAGCAAQIRFSEEENALDEVTPMASCEPLPHQNAFAERVNRCLGDGKGAIFEFFGGRGSGKSRRLKSMIAEVKRTFPRKFNHIDILDTDPWEKRSSFDSLLEICGLWFWLSVQLSGQAESRRSLLLPNHFLRQDPMGRCPACSGELVPPADCPACLGSGLSEKVLKLKCFGFEVGTLWQMPLQEILPLIGESAPSEIRARLSAFVDAGLGGYAGKVNPSMLSSGQESGVMLLKLIWSSPAPSFLAFDEPFRQTDFRLRAIVSHWMQWAAEQGSVLVSMSEN